MPRVPPDMKRPVCEDSLSIDVRRWRRDGLLPYQKFSCTWCSGDQALASINVTIEADAAFLAKAVAAVLTFQWRRRETAEWTQACACPSCGPSAISAGPDHGSYALKIPEMGGAVAAASQSCTPATVISLPAVSVVAWPMHLKVRARMIEAFSASGKPRFGLITYTSPQPLLSLQELQHHVFGWLLSCTAALL